MHAIRVGVVGVGHLGSIHARLYKEIPGCTLAGVADTDPERLQAVSGELGVPGYADCRRLFGTVDALSIAVPTRLHYRIAADSLKAGKDVLVEKPFTATLKEADALIALARARRRILQVGHIERFNSAFAATRQLIRNPRFIECHRLSPFPNRSLDVGVVLDLMIHDIDIVLGLVDSRLRTAEAVGVAVLSRFEDIANARLTFANGCVANLTASRVSEDTMRKIRIFFSNAYISLDYRNEQAHLYRKSAAGIAKENLPIEREQPLKKELASFIACCAQRTTPLVSGRVARAALSVALDIQKKIWKKKPAS